MGRVKLKALAKWVLLAPALAEMLSVPRALAQERPVLAGEGETAGEAIVVTARKVAEPLVKTPLAVTSISGKTINDAGLQTLAEALHFAPNVDIGGGLAGELQGMISIRGYSTLVRNIGLEAGVGVYVDDVFVGRPENFTQRLLDVDRIEVLRGPQGTEYGKNTIAGVISVKSRQPDSEAGGHVQVETGNYNLISGEAAYGGRLSETLSARAAISYVSRDGFYQHLSGGKDADSADLLTWRLAAKLAPSDGLSFTLRGDGLRDRGTPGFFQADALAGYPASFPSNQPHRINNNRPDSLSRDNAGVSLTADWTGSGISVVSITAYRHSSYDAALDDDQEQVDFVAADDFGDDSDMFSQELRATGALGPLKYLVGGYWFDQAVDTNRKLGLGADLGVPGNPVLSTRGRVETKSGALFTRLDYQVTRQFQLSAGLRYTNETKSARFTQFDPSGIFAFLGFPNLEFADKTNDEDLSPSFSASLEIADGINLYGRFAQGFKSAAFNVDIASSLEGLSADPEKATSYEAGLKLALLDNRLRFDLTAFLTDYDRLQVPQMLGSGTSLTNAGKAKSKGLEGELTFLAPFGLRLEGSAGILDAYYTQFMDCGIPRSMGGGVGDCSGNDLVLAPHFSGHAAVQYERPVGEGEIFARADLDYRSAVYFEPTNSQAFKAGDRTLLNLRLGWRHGRWNATAWVENVTDATYKSYADDRSGLGVLRTAAYGPPRTYGVTLRMGL